MKHLKNPSKALKHLKHFAFLLLATTMVFGCSKYDDSDLTNRVTKLEEWQKNVDGHIASLKDLVKALETKDFVTAVTPLDDKTGYEISFVKSGKVTIKHGTNPTIGTKKHADDKYYWTINGEWLLNDKKEKVPVTGEAGITPKFQINKETNFLEVSSDDGKTWNSLGIKMAGDDGRIGVFSEIDNTNANYVVLTLADGKTTIQLPRYKTLRIGKDTGNEAFKITSTEAVTIPLVLPTGFKEADYTAIMAQVTSNKGTSSDIQTRAASVPWTVTVKKPTFDNGVCNNDASVTVTPAADISTGETAVLEVTIVGSNGEKTVATLALKYDITETTMAYIIDVPVDFSTSYVHKVMDRDTQIAEVCKEFIKTSTVSEQMIVIYPVISGKADLTKGFVVKDGGSVVWDISKNSCTYTAGTLGEPLKKVCLEKDQLAATPVSLLRKETHTKSDILIDSDKNEYRIVKIGTQYWMADNFKCEKYRNGSPIKNIDNGLAWKNDTEGAYCYVNNDPNEYKNIFGALYNWHAVVNDNKLAPEGWDIPTQQDFLSLKTYIIPGANITKAIKCSAYLKATDGYWQAAPDNKTTNPNNLTGFSMQPTGRRAMDTSDLTYSYSFQKFGQEAYFWSTTEYSGDDFLNKGSVYVMRAAYNTDNNTQGPLGKAFGMSVRCIKK